MAEYSTMPVLTGEGTIWVEVEDSAERSLVGSYWNAVHHYRDTGELQQLDAFAGQQVAGQLLETDPDEVELWAQQGELDFEDIYESD